MIDGIGQIVQTPIVNRATGVTEGIYHEWRGPDVARLDARRGMNFKPGDRVWIGPFRALVLGPDFAYLAYAVLRYRSPLTRLYATAWHASRWLDRAYRRAIITAAIWGLADVTLCQSTRVVASWRDLHIVKRLRR